jgi:hypothetical protein
MVNSSVHGIIIFIVFDVEFVYIYIYIQCDLLFSHRCKKVYDGVTHAAKLYPNAYIIMILIGTLKGKLQFLRCNGCLTKSFLRYFDRSFF